MTEVEVRPKPIRQTASIIVIIEEIVLIDGHALFNAFALSMSQRQRIYGKSDRVEQVLDGLKGLGDLIGDGLDI